MQNKDKKQQKSFHQTWNYGCGLMQNKDKKQLGVADALKPLLWFDVE